MTDVTESVDQTVTQLFTPQTYIPQGFYGNDMINITLDMANVQNIFAP